MAVVRECGAKGRPDVWCLAGRARCREAGREWCRAAGQGVVPLVGREGWPSEVPSHVFAAVFTWWAIALARPAGGVGKP